MFLGIVHIVIILSVIIIQLCFMLVSPVLEYEFH